MQVIVSGQYLVQFLREVDALGIVGFIYSRVSWPIDCIEISLCPMILATYVVL